MNLRRLLTAVLLLTVGLVRASAHNVAPDPVVDVLVKPAGDHLTVEVRVPISVLADANLPRNPDGHFAQAEITQALELVARGMAQDLEFQQGDDRLAMPVISASLSPDEGTALVNLNYLIRPGPFRLSARLRSFQAGGQLVRTDAHYVVDEGTTRTFRIEGDPERVSFEPAPSEVVARFVRRGIDLLLTTGDYFLFALCLIAVRRRNGVFLRACAALLCGQAFAIVLYGLNWLTLSPGALLVAQAVAASAIVIAAIQDFVNPDSRWVWPLALLFGVVNGLSVGDRFVSDSAFAGSHVTLGAFCWLLSVCLGMVWILALLASAADLLRRRGKPSELAVLALSIVAGHASLHRLVDRGQDLAELGTVSLDRFLLRLVLGWACLILCAGILEAIYVSGFGTRWQTPLARARSGERE